MLWTRSLKTEKTGIFSQQQIMVKSLVEVMTSQQIVNNL